MACNSARLSLNAVVPALGAVCTALRAVAFLSNAMHVEISDKLKVMGVRAPSPADNPKRKPLSRGDFLIGIGDSKVVSLCAKRREWPPFHLRGYKMEGPSIRIKAASAEIEAASAEIVEAFTRVRILCFFNAFHLEILSESSNFAAQNGEKEFVLFYIYLQNNEKTEIYPDGSSRACPVLLQ